MRNENAYPGATTISARPAPAAPRAGWGTSVAPTAGIFDLVASFSISGKKSRVGTRASVTMVRCVSQPARKRFGISGELIGRFQQHAPALQQHPPNVGNFVR